VRRILKWTAFVVGGLVLLVGVGGGWIFVNTTSRLNRVYEVNPAPVQIATAYETRAGNGASGQMAGAEMGTATMDSAEDAGGSASNGNRAADPMAAALAWGEHIAMTRGCTDCHGQDFGGGLFADAMPVFRLSASNLTPGGVGAEYSDQDWVRSIRHGIRPDGTPLLYMPALEYYYLNDNDLAALILYLKSLPPVERDTGENAVGPMGRALLFTGKLPLLSAEFIDHEAPRPNAPPRGATVEYGAYLAKGCIGCHGETLSGGPIPGVPPDWPPASNLTRDGETGLEGWSREDFFRAMREGLRPDGTQLQAQFMPWPNIGTLHDDELEALWMYLEVQEARAFGGR